LDLRKIVFRASGVYQSDKSGLERGQNILVMKNPEKVRQVENKLGGIT
jgi:hypothetical protein